MKTSAAIVLGAGLGMLAAQLIAIAGWLSLDWWSERCRRG